MKHKILYILLCICCSWIYQSCKETGIPAQVTFTEHVAPILYKNCISCHRSGGPSHFSLVTYNQAKSYAGSISYVTEQRIMPPWPADPNYTHFKGEQTLSKNEIAILKKWEAQGMKEGPASALPDYKSYILKYGGPEPDLKIAVSPVTLEKYSNDKFLLVKVPYELPKDTFAALVAFVPGNINKVHHVNGDMVKYQYEKKSDVFSGLRVVNMEEDTASLVKAFEKLGLPNDDGSYPTLQKSVVNYLPGAIGQQYPEGLGGYYLPRKGVFLLNDMHYGFNKDTAQIDSSYIYVYYSKTPPKRPVQEFQLGTLGAVPVLPDLMIQPNTIKKVYSKMDIPVDISVLTVNPHMHLLGKSFKAYAVTEKGDTIRLISIPRWDFNWQYFYTFPKMVKIPARSSMYAEGIYDNTTQNINNPFSPPRLVTDQKGSMKATDEMFQFIVTYLPYVPGDEHISL